MVWCTKVRSNQKEDNDSKTFHGQTTKKANSNINEKEKDKIKRLTKHQQVGKNRNSTTSTHPHIHQMTLRIINTVRDKRFQW